MPKYRIIRTTIISEEETKQFINATDMIKDKALIALLYLYGCRPSELFNVMKGDFWVEEERLWLNIETKKTRLKEGKDIVIQRKRFVYSPLNHFTHVIQDYLKTCELEVPVFRFGKSVAVHNVTIDRILKGVNNNICAYLFRHTRNTLIAECGGTDSQLVAWNGWRDSRPAGRYVKHTKALVSGIPLPKPSEPQP